MLLPLSYREPSGIGARIQFLLVGGAKALGIQLMYGLGVWPRARAMNGRNCVPKRKIVSQNESSRFVESSPIRVFSVSILSRGHFCVPILQKIFYVLVSGFSCISGYFRTFID